LSARADSSHEGGRHRYIAASLVLLVALVVPSTGAQLQHPFAARIAALSEPGGSFDTDNLISNERSYLDVLPDLQRAGIRGGAYVGVGPDQNFSYIAAVRPDIAFIIDIRRDNMLLHLLFKALFELSRTRVEYASLLFGRAIPREVESWRRASAERLLEHARGPRADDRTLDGRRKRIEVAIRSFGVPLSSEDLATIARFHRRFVEDGPALRFQSAGRPPQSYYPDYGDLLTARDPSGRQAHFLASEDAFQFVKGLQSRDSIVPVVGNVSGPSAMTAIGRLIDQRHEHLSAFYVSNVERYLFRDGWFEQFVKNLSTIPHAPNAVLIRSVFGRSYGWGASTSHVQRVDELLQGFATGRFRDYDEVISKH
jgi:hypothetical protein